MSAILSADDLNDFISPGVACIKPVETLPRQAPQDIAVRCASLTLFARANYGGKAFEVTTEDQAHQADVPPAQITLTDCLACSGCVTSAEAVLISLQSHSEVLNALDSHPSINVSQLLEGDGFQEPNGKLFIASVSPQVRASIAATYRVSEFQAGCMIEQLLIGPQGIASSGKYGNGFAWVVDTNAMREASLVLAAGEVTESLQHGDNQRGPDINAGASSFSPTKPILSSACPGWICYAEKTHPYVLPHLSRLKSPQALTGTLLKTVLSKCLNIRPDHIWHVSVMPCFDKKLEASREELTDIYWRLPALQPSTSKSVRDVDCVVTARELIMLADTRGISFPALPAQPVASQIPFPDPFLSTFLFPELERSFRGSQTPDAGTSGGYLHHILQTQLASTLDSKLTITRGRNVDLVEYSITSPDHPTPSFKAARYYGFRNIQNLVRKLKPAKKSRMPGERTLKPRKATGVDYHYVEVMACPGGCTNGGGQIKVDDLPLKPETAMNQKEWLARVDEAYFSLDENDDENHQDALVPMESAQSTGDMVNGISPGYIRSILNYWSSSTGIELPQLVRTNYREVKSDVGKVGSAENDRVVELASKVGGGW